MLVAVHQPESFPWPGYFAKMKSVDKFIIQDNVQFEKGYVQNRNILEKNKNPSWYTLPLANHKFNSLISDIHIQTENKAYSSIISNLRNNYSLSNSLLPTVIECLEAGTTKLADLNLNIINLARDFLGIETKLELASNYESISSDPTIRIIESIKLIGGDAYLSGPAGRNYLRQELFEKNGIKLYFSSFQLQEKFAINGKFQYSMFHWIFKNSFDLEEILKGKIEK